MTMANLREQHPVGLGGWEPECRSADSPWSPV